MIDNFKTDLVVRAAAMHPEDILKSMGYLRATSASAIEGLKVQAMHVVRRSETLETD